MGNVVRRANREFSLFPVSVGNMTWQLRYRGKSTSERGSIGYHGLPSRRQNGSPARGVNVFGMTRWSRVSQCARCRAGLAFPTSVNSVRRPNCRGVNGDGSDRRRGVNSAALMVGVVKRGDGGRGPCHVTVLRRYVSCRGHDRRPGGGSTTRCRQHVQVVFRDLRRTTRVGVGKGRVRCELWW